jgi:hypothetical protein
VKPTRDLAVPAAGTVVRCAVIAHGSVQVTEDMLGKVRHNPGPPAGQALPPSFLKHADEQTVVAMAAVLQAIHSSQLAAIDFTNWGVLAAPRYLGRLTTIQALQRFAAEGAWGISPHLIPHRTLHALSGTISQALAIHGPNLGVGGGPDAAREVMAVAASFLSTENLPGIWVVMTGWDPEPAPAKATERFSIPSTNGHGRVPVCGAVALALTALPRLWQGLQLEIHVAASRERKRPEERETVARNGTPHPALLSVENLMRSLRETNGTIHGTWTLGQHGWMELTQVGAGAEKKS